MAELHTCRYLGPQILDLFVPGGIDIIVNNVGAFPRIRDRNGTLYVIKPEHYHLVDAWGEQLSDEETKLFLKQLTKPLTML